MARIRTVKPDFWTDEKVVEISAFARLLFIGLWNFADDEGRMVYSPKRIKMQIFPADNLDITELFGEIRGNSMIKIYVVDNVEYLEISNFAKHQKIDKRSESKLPPPPNSTESPRIPTTEGKGMEGNGRTTSTKQKIILTNDGRFENLNSHLEVWNTSYPNVEVEKEILRAGAWCKSNPRKAPKSDFPRFLNAWLSRTNETNKSNNDDVFAGAI